MGRFFFFMQRGANNQLERTALDSDAIVSITEKVTDNKKVVVIGTVDGSNFVATESFEEICRELDYDEEED